MYRAVKMLADKSGYPDAIISSISNTLGSEKDKQEFKIVLSTGLVQNIRLDSPLVKPESKQSGTPANTDGDDLNDWDEVNTDFILKMLARRKNYDDNAVNAIEEISSEQLPTLREFIYNYESKYYVYSIRSILEEKYRIDLDDLRILPVLSVPTDADGDNDGVPDFYDNNPVKKAGIIEDMKPNSESKVFYVSGSFTPPRYITKEAGSTIKVYSLPESGNAIYTYDSKEAGSIKVSDVAINDKGAWLKVLCDENSGLMGYVFADDATNSSSIIAPYKREIAFLKMINVPRIVEAEAFGLNEIMQYISVKNYFKLSVIELIKLENACAKVINAYKKADKNKFKEQDDKEIRRIVSAYLTPELLMGAAGPESGYFGYSENGFLNYYIKGSGFGLTDGGTVILKNMIGGENLSPKSIDYLGNFELSAEASAVIIADQIVDAFKYKNRLANIYIGDKANDGQVLFNALFRYGSYGNPSDYYGVDDNGEGVPGINAITKFYAYAEICYQTGGICAIPSDYIQGGAINYATLGKLISDYTRLNEKNQWRVSLSE